MFGWVKRLAGPLGRLLRRPEDVARVAEAANELVQAVRAGTSEPPAGPLPRRHEDHIRTQIDSATAHKVVAAKEPPEGPSKVDDLTPEETDEMVAKLIAPRPIARAVDRAAATPRPKPPRRKDPTK